MELKAENKRPQDVLAIAKLMAKAYEKMIYVAEHSSYIMVPASKQLLNTSKYELFYLPI